MGLLCLFSGKGVWKVAHLSIPGKLFRRKGNPIKNIIEKEGYFSDHYSIYYIF